MKILGPKADKPRKYSIVSWINKDQTKNLLNINEVDTFLQSKSRHIFYSDKQQKKKYIYHIAIIDYLTKYDFWKKGE